MFILLKNHDRLCSAYLDELNIDSFYTQKSLTSIRLELNKLVSWLKDNSNLVSSDEISHEYAEYLKKKLGNSEEQTKEVIAVIEEYLSWLSKQEALNSIESQSKSGFVVGIGASAGGLEALERFFSSSEISPKLSYVVIQHLSPDFKSMMSDILSRVTLLPIKTIENGMLIEPGHIYLNNPRSDVAIQNNRFVQNEIHDENVLHLPINSFLRSLAFNYKDQSVAVILSGTGRDGSLGVTDVYQNGGLVISQDPKTAIYSSMPEAAALNGPAHLLLAPEDIPSALNQFAKTGIIPEKNDELAEIGINAENAFSYLLSLLQRKFGIDFNVYKNATLVRRIERRMNLGLHKNLQQFVHDVKSDEDMLDELYRDMLVDVTSFFRDEEAFEIIKNDIIPKIVDAKKDGDTIRVWSAACASGEEAYSVTILFLEEIEKQKKKIDFKVFATDAHKDSISRASLGEYDESKVLAMPDELSERYFEKIDDDTYKVTKKLRKNIIFAPHDLLNDGVFSNLDFVSCRNMLIYLKPEAQMKVLTQLGNGLNIDGVLFLGSSEHLGTIREYFEIVNSKWRIYRKTHSLPVQNAVSKYLSINLPEPRSARPSFSKGWEKDLVKKIAPNGYVVDAQGGLVEIFGFGKEFVQFRAGRVNLGLTNILDDPLSTTVKSGLYNVRESNEPLTLRGIKVSKEQDIFLNITFIPFDYKKKDAVIKYYFIRLEKNEGADAGEAIEVRAEDMDRVIGLERELEFTRESLQASLEEVETTNEELQTTNEEMIASNEELQSTNEELSSVNEELITVNAEYQSQNKRLNQINSDLENLLQNTETLAIFLSRDLKIRIITPSAFSVFGLLESDISRPIHQFSPFLNIGEETIEQLCKEALRGRRVESSLVLRDKTKLELTVRPYEKEDKGIKSIDGVILRFIDVTQTLKKTHQELNDFNEKLFVISSDNLTVIDSGGLVVGMNPAGMKLAELDDIEVINGLPWSSLWPNPAMVDKAVETAKRKGSAQFETYCPSAKGTPRWLNVYIVKIKNAVTGNHDYLINSRDITASNQDKIKAIIES